MSEPKDEKGNPRVEMLNTVQAADLIGMSRVWVWEQCTAGRIPHIRFGKMIKIRRDVAERIAEEGLPAEAK